MESSESIQKSILIESSPQPIIGRVKDPAEVLQDIKLVVKWDRHYRQVESSLAAARESVNNIEKEIARLQDNWQLTT
jgi:hypothetical protein